MLQNVADDAVNYDDTAEVKEEEEMKEQSVTVRIDCNINKNVFQDIQHFIKNPYVIILGVDTYNKQRTGWDELPGVKEDINNMKDLWQNKLKYSTEVLTDYDEYRNCSKDNVVKFIKKCAANAEKATNYDGLICIVSGHGVADNFICGDGDKIEINKDLFVRFSATYVTNLANFPKIFLFDICRGKSYPDLIEKERGNSPADKMLSLNIESGYRISYSTTKNKTALDTEGGGKFIQAFYQVMVHLYNTKQFDKYDFQSILRMASQKVTAKSNFLCPVHEDYTVYKLFLQCEYGDDISDEELSQTFPSMSTGSIIKSVSLDVYNNMKVKPVWDERQRQKKEYGLSKLKNFLEKEEVELGQYYDLLVGNGFEKLEDLDDITLKDLKDIGIVELGYRKRLLKYIKKRKEPKLVEKKKRKKRKAERQIQQEEKCNCCGLECLIL